MLNQWGYLYFASANALTYAETTLEQYRAETGGTVAGHGTSILDPNSAHADLVAHKCDEVLRFIEDSRDELTPIPFRLEMLRTKIGAAALKRNCRCVNLLLLAAGNAVEEFLVCIAVGYLAVTNSPLPRRAKHLLITRNVSSPRCKNKSLCENRNTGA